MESSTEAGKKIATGWEEAATELFATGAGPSTSTVPDAKTDTCEKLTSSSGAPPIAHIASTTEVTSTSGMGWQPGMIFRALKKQVEEHELVKKLREVPTKIREQQQQRAAGSSSDGLSPEGGPATVTPQVKAKLPVLSLNHPLYDKAIEWKNKNRLESQKRTVDYHNKVSRSVDLCGAMPHPASGLIRISDVALEDIPAWAKRSPYVLFSIEARSETTPRASSKGPYSWDGWTSPEIPVTDMWGDLHIQVFAGKPGSQVVALDDDLVGRAIVPLSNVALLFNQPWLRTLFTSSSTRHETELCIQLLPLDAHTRMYTRCVEGLPTTGMARPEEQLGSIRLRLHVRILMPLARALLQTTPSRSPSLPVYGEPMNSSVLHQRKMRIKNIMALYIWVFHTLVEDILSWANPFATWVWLTLFTQIALFSELYHLPFLISVCAVLGSYFVRLQNLKRGNPLPPILFTDETTLDPEIPQTIAQKIKALQFVVAGLQRGMGVVVSILERMFFALSWEDPFISFLVSICLLSAGFAISVVLGLLTQFTYILRPVLFAAGLALHAPSSTQITIKRKLTRVLEKMVPDQRSGTMLPLSSSEAMLTKQDSEHKIEDILQDRPVETSSPLTAAVDTKSDSFKSRVRVAWLNLLRRIPDAPEIDHRRIAHARLWEEVIIKS